MCIRDSATGVTALLNQGGLYREAVNDARMKVIEPSLSGEFYGGYFTPSDATGDIHKYTRGLADACVRMGARFCCDTDVGVVTHKGKGLQLEFRSIEPGNESGVKSEEFDGVVVCAGTSSRGIAEQLGDCLLYTSPSPRDRG